MTPDSPTTPQQVSLYQFVSNTPAPVVRLLVELSPLISYVRWLAETLSWTNGNTAESWLVVAVWWALCLTAEFGVRFLLPSLLLIPIVIQLLSPRIPFLRRLTNRSDNGPPATESTISQTLADVHAINALLPHLPQVPTLPPPTVVLRIISIVYIPYLVIVYVCSVKVLVALVGTVLVTWRSPWATSSRRILSRSGWAKWVVYRSWRVLSGQTTSLPFVASSTPAPSPTNSKHSINNAPEYDLPEPTHLRFQFIVFENQRWWVGLDFTAALLPGERPSWCAPPPSMVPLPPPGSLALPGPTTVLLPLASKADPLKPLGLRMKRTSQWTWEDQDWGVTVRTIGKDGNLHEERIKMDPPMDESNGGSTSRLMDAVGKGFRRAQNSSDGSPTRDSGLFHHFTHAKEGSPSRSEAAPRTTAIPSDNDTTDSDGWVYADNKWEAASPARGRGKFTRYRRWVRVAVLEETIEVIPEEAAAEIERAAQEKASPKPSPTASPKELRTGRTLSPVRRRVTNML
ncbi:hypothetical protein FRB99_004242 [Tulasnella sp. 403]|nr:hypothetical protein FRB99_004242 [Tulasnella sp. 403]